ncbi:MAG: hypothetical protein ACE5KT_05695 [Methanosarcinales archaeon]
MVQKQIEIIQKIQKQKDGLVEKVENFFEERNGDSKQKVPVTRTQLHNVLGMAIATDSVKEIINYLKHQIARHKEWREDNFGKNLIEKINEVSVTAGNDRNLKIQLVRLFLGYFAREARYVRKDWEAKGHEE